MVAAARRSPPTLACYVLLSLLVGTVTAAQSQSYTSQIQMGITNPVLQTRQTYYVPDGQCSAQIMPPQICGGSQPLAIRVEVTDGAPFPVLQVLETLQTVYLFRAAADTGECAGPASVLLQMQCS